MIIRNPKKIKTVTQGIFQTLRICRQPCSAGVRRCVTAAGRYRCFQICHPNLSLHQKFANRQNILISRQKPFHNQNITCRRYSYCSVHSFFASRTIPALCFWNRIFIHSHFFVTVQKSHPGFSFLLHGSKSLPFFSVSAASFYQIRKKTVHLRRCVNQPFRMPLYAHNLSVAAFNRLDRTIRRRC